MIQRRAYGFRNFNSRSEDRLHLCEAAKRQLQIACDCVVWLTETVLAPVFGEEPKMVGVTGSGEKSPVFIPDKYPLPFDYKQLAPSFVFYISTDLLLKLCSSFCSFL